MASSPRHVPDFTGADYLHEMFSLEGRIALVTGGSSGIGRALGLALSRCGATVVLLGRDHDRLGGTVTEIRQAGGRAAAVSADLGDERAVERAATAAIEPFGEPDILVNAAGAGQRPPLAEIDAAEWARVLAVNLTAPFLLGQRFGPSMARRGWGRIISVASQQAVRAYGNSGVYGVSKAGLAALVRSQAEAWSPHGVCCNAIVPGLVRTPLTQHLFDENIAAAHATRTMIGRNSDTSDIEGLAILLSGPASSYLTGQTIFVDGGLSSH